VEELQNALMLCWPEIIEHRPRFYVVDKPPHETAKESFLKDNFLSGHKPINQHQVEIHVDAEVPPPQDLSSEEAWKLSHEDMQDALVRAAQPLDISTSALKRRHGVLTQEVWLLRGEVAALQEHLGLLESEDPAAQGMNIDRSSASALPEAFSASQERIHVAEQIQEVTWRLRDSHREADAVEITAAAARLMRIQDAWQKAQSANEEDKTQEPGPGMSDEETEARIVSSLHSEDGTKAMRHAALRTVSELRKLAQSLRDGGADVEGNMTEAIALKLGSGLLSDEDLSHSQAENKMNHGIVRKSTRFIFPHDAALPPGREGELMTLDRRIIELSDHLHALHQMADAKIVDLMASRLLAMRQICKNTASLPVSSRPDPEACAKGADLQRILETLGTDDGCWREVGPLAANAMADTTEVGTRLRHHGLHEEADSLTALMEELARGLIADYGGSAIGGSTIGGSNMRLRNHGYN